MQGSLLKDVARAIEDMRREDLLDPRKLLLSPDEIIERCIKSTRFYRSKVRKLKEMTALLERFQFSVGRMKLHLKKVGVKDGKGMLMNIRGVGSETADMILLQVCGIPVIPADRGLMRILERLYDEDFNEIQTELENIRDKGFSNILPPLVLLLLEHSRVVCKSKPKCSVCVLKEECKSAPGGI